MARSAISAEQLKIPPKPCGKMTAAGLFCVFGRVWGGSMHRAKNCRCPALQYMQTVRGAEQKFPAGKRGFFMTERMGVLSSDGRCLQPSPLAARAMLRPAARRLAAVGIGFAGGWAVLYGALMPFGLGLTLGLKNLICLAKEYLAHHLGLFRRLGADRDHGKAAYSSHVPLSESYHSACRGLFTQLHPIAFEQFAQFDAIGVGNEPHGVSLLRSVRRAVGMRTVAFRAQVEE